MGNSYHPAFRQLVEGAIAREIIEEKINELFPDAVKPGGMGDESQAEGQTVKVISNGREFSNVIGHKAVNKKYFENEYPWLNITYDRDNTLADGIITVVKLNIDN